MSNEWQPSSTTEDMEGQSRQSLIENGRGQRITGRGFKI